MAVRFTPAGQSFSRSAGLPSSNAYSACGFLVLASNPASAYTLFGLDDGTAYCLLLKHSAGTLAFVDSTGSDVIPGSLSTGVPCFWGVTKSSGSVVVYLRDLSTSTMSTASTAAALTGLTPTVMELGSDSFSEDMDGEMSGTRVWDAALSADEMYRESCSIRPARSANLHGWWPMLHSTVANCALDFSGNGRSWTVNGTPTIAQGAPVPWGGEKRRPQKAAGGGGGSGVGPGILGWFGEDLRPQAWF